MNGQLFQNQFGESPRLYVADADGMEETCRVMEIAVMGVDWAEPALFLPENSDPAPRRKEWQQWLEDRFSLLLARHFSDVYAASMEMRIRRLTELDNALDGHLTAFESQRSQRAARAFLEGESEARYLTQKRKFALRIDGGECPGHVTTVFALQAALYHLPLVSALLSYCYYEWRCGHAGFGLPEEELSPLKFQKVSPEGVGAVRAFFAMEKTRLRTL